MFLFFLSKEGVDNMQKYAYDGPVMEFNTCIVNRWRGETTAPSEARARNNLAYQFKRKNSRLATAKITLPGQVKLVAN